MTADTEPLAATPCLPAAADPWIGRSVGCEFELCERIGGGRRGAVFRARQRPYGRPVAVKILAGRASIEAQRELQRLRAAPMLRTWSSPSIVRVIRVGLVPPEHDQPAALFVARELVDGVSLRAVLAEGPIDPLRAGRITLQLLEALADAHRHGVVHGDLHPGHIMSTRDALGMERVKVLDFGLASPTDGTVMQGFDAGSACYLAPEPLRGAPAGPATDQYAVGAMLHEMLTGAPPFAGDIADVLRAHLRGVVRPLPRELDPDGGFTRIVQRAMAKEPAARFQSAREMALAVEAALARRSDRTPTVQMDPIEARRARRRSRSVDDVTPPVAAALPVSPSAATAPSAAALSQVRPPMSSLGAMLAAVAATPWSLS